MSTATPILADPFQEAGRAIEAATAAGVHLRALGGVGIGMLCPRAHHEPLARPYGDVDFVAPRAQCREVEALFAELGYVAEEDFNALHGEWRLFFLDPENGREADVFLDAVRGCHHLDVTHRLGIVPRTLTPADLLLSKLQIRATNHKDRLDIFALLLCCELRDDDAGIDRGRLSEVCGSDWGWWRTVTEVARATADAAPEILSDPADVAHVRSALDEVVRVIDEAPKSRRWKLRSRIGDRVAWYEEPEELDHAH